MSVKSSIDRVVESRKKIKKNKVKKEKLGPPEDDALDMALSGDILNYDPNQKKIAEVLAAINKYFDPPFGETESIVSPQEAADTLFNSEDIEVNPDYLCTFAFVRDAEGLDRDYGLVVVDGIILPDGRIYSNLEASDNTSLGGALYETPQDYAKNLYAYWHATRSHVLARRAGRRHECLWNLPHTSGYYKNIHE